MSELVPTQDAALLVHPATGEVLEATPENAALLLKRLREFRSALNDAVRACEGVLVEHSAVAGTKTLHLGQVTAKITGGPEVLWDVEELRAGLRDAGLPEDRLGELVRETVEYKVNASVARQIASANPEYARVVEAAKQTVEKPWRVSV